MKYLSAFVLLAALVTPAAAAELPAKLHGDWCLYDSPKEGLFIYERGGASDANGYHEACPADWLKVSRRRFEAPEMDRKLVGAIGAKYRFKCGPMGEMGGGGERPTLFISDGLLHIQY